MATSVSIDEVTTGDVAPAVAPHRISGQATKDVATLTFTPWDEGLLPDEVDLLPSETDVLPSESLYPSATLYPGAGGLLPDDGGKVIGVRIVVGGITPYTGKLVGRKGLPCSDSLPCGESVACSEWESPSGVQLSEDVTAAELSPDADGAKTVNVWADFEGAWL